MKPRRSGTRSIEKCVWLSGCGTALDESKAVNRRHISPEKPMIWSVQPLPYDNCIGQLQELPDTHIQMYTRNEMCKISAKMNCKHVKRDEMYVDVRVVCSRHDHEREGEYGQPSSSMIHNKKVGHGPDQASLGPKAA